MEKVAIVISIAAFLNAISIIIAFMRQFKKPVDKVIDNRFKEALKPLNNKLETIEKRTDKIDENQCRNFLVDFLADVEAGIEERNTENCFIYDYYNSIIFIKLKIMVRKFFFRLKRKLKKIRMSWSEKYTNKY